MHRRSFVIIALLAASCSDGMSDGPDPSAAGKSDNASTGAVGSACDPHANACAPGLLCCAPCCRNQPAACVVPPAQGPGAGKCPLPDLTVDSRALSASLESSVFPSSADLCELPPALHDGGESCLLGFGVRKIIRFDIVTPNIGTADVDFGDPKCDPSHAGPCANPLFMFSTCHQHPHFSGYAEYRLLDATGKAVLVGRKQPFCLMDFHKISDPSDPNDFIPGGKFDCLNQGISVGWEDTYNRFLPCSHLDVTDVPPGHYIFEVEINPDRVVPELNYDNNVARQAIVLP